MALARRDTLIEMHTELNAVPHAGLGYHFLRVQVRKPEKKWRPSNVQRSSKPKAPTITRQGDDVTAVQTGAKAGHLVLITSRAH